MIENIDLNRLIEKAKEEQCEITITCEPNRTEITIQPRKQSKRGTGGIIMDEYIERKKILLELAEAYDCIDPRFSRGRAIREAIALIKRKINAMPTADVAPVVRCKECKYFEVEDSYKDGVLCVQHGHRFSVPKPDDYCSYGERREEA